jgi:DNA-3-methyladenine glycosylase
VPPLPPEFYDRDALDVAHDLIGAFVECGGVKLRISEVEAYRFPGDTANHARMGKTVRNAPMWGPPGHAYVYLCYGLHRMLNFVTGPADHAAAVLVRGGECVAGEGRFRARRPDGSCDGPGKVGSALGLSVAQSGSPLFGGGDILVFAPVEAHARLHGPRIGIDYADEAHRLAPWRVAMAGSTQVGRPRQLSPFAGEGRRE